VNTTARAQPMMRCLAWNLSSALGDSATVTGLLWRAGVHNVAASRFVRGNGEAVEFCASPELAPDLMGVERLAQLAGTALRGLFANAAIDPSRPHVALIALPERLALAPGSATLNAAGQRLLDLLTAALPARLAIEAFPYGRAAGAAALQRARDIVAGGALVIWGGVDSLYDWSIIEALDAELRLLTPDNVDGVRPGEASAFVLLGPPVTGGAHFTGMGLARERPALAPSPVVRPTALAKAIAAAGEGPRAQRRRCASWYLDTTHETVSTQRLQHLLTACADMLAPATTLHTPLKDLGDIGAAALPMFAALALEAWSIGLAEDDEAVLAACSDSGACGAAMLSTPRGELEPSP
jgi:3-oxoacyl-[acyl-carrier-protein] synthase-1